MSSNALFVGFHAEIFLLEVPMNIGLKKELKMIMVSSKKFDYFLGFAKVMTGNCTHART